MTDHMTNRRSPQSVVRQVAASRMPLVAGYGDMGNEGQDVYYSTLGQI